MAQIDTMLFHLLSALGYATVFSSRPPVPLLPWAEAPSPLK